MSPRPTRRIIALETAALVAAVGVGVLSADRGDWNMPLLATLLAIAVFAERSAIDTAASRVTISGNFLAIVVAIVFLGPTPAALI